ncbi:MAG: amidohydrolase family protein [Acidimicrobiales bacterium]
MSARVENFGIYSDGSRIGTISATCDADTVQLEFGVFNNGRGAKLSESLRLGAGHVPLEWRISGNSLMGGAVDEVLTTNGHLQSWRGQADEGVDEDSELKLYLAADTSPFAIWIYASAALAAGGSIAAIPSGSVRAESVSSVRLDDSGPGQDLDVVAVTGATLTPQYVLLDSERRLVGLGGGNLQGGLPEMTLRDDVATQAARLSALVTELMYEHLEQIRHKVLHRYELPVRIADVRIFDPDTETLTEPMSVSFFRGKITVVQPQRLAVPVADEVVVDGAGGVLVAGLHDMHAHVNGWSGLFYIAAGVTSVRDMGNYNEMLLDLMSRFAAGTVVGPTVVPSGFIEGKSEFSAKMGVIPETLEQALETVRSYGARGYHQIKLYNSMNPDWVKPMAAEAHRLGMRSVGHVPAFTTPDRMIEDGYDEVTHINQLMLGWMLTEGEDTRSPLRLTAMARAADLDLSSERVLHTVRLMQDNRIGLDTTAVILERLMLSRARTVTAGDAPYLDHMPVSYQRLRKRTYVPYQDETELDAYTKSFSKLLEVMMLLRKKHIRLWPGTDDGTGFTLHRELELYVSAGMRPPEVLRIATRDCAEHLGLGYSHGSVERGKSASFILLGGDPTSDISAIRNIRAVVKDGDVYFPSEIYAQLNVAPFAPAPTVSLPGRPGLPGGAVTV